MSKNFIKTIFASIVLLLTSIALISCNTTPQNNDKNKEEKKKVVTTAWFSYDITKQIAKDKFDVEMAFPYSTSLHDLEPTAEVYKKLYNADLLVLTSSFIDDKLVGDKANKAALPHESKILDLFSSLFPNYGQDGHHHHHHHDHDHDHNHEHENMTGHNHENEGTHTHEEGETHNHKNENTNSSHTHEEGENHSREHENMPGNTHEGEDHNHDHSHNHDEDAHRIEHIKSHAYFHYWTSIKNVIDSAKIITQRLIQLDSKNEAFFTKNLETFETNYTNLKNEFKTYLMNKTVEPIMYVGHDSIGAFMIEFDLVNKYLPFDINIDDHNEATAQMKRAFIEEINEHNLKVIFVPEMNEKEKEAKSILTEVNQNKEETEKVKALEFHGFHNISKEVYETKSLLDLFTQNIENLKQLIK